MRKKWTNPEVDLLIKNYSVLGPLKLANQLNRNMKSVS